MSQLLDTLKVVSETHAKLIQRSAIVIKTDLLLNAMAVEFGEHKNIFLIQLKKEYPVQQYRRGELIPINILNAICEKGNVINE